LLEYPEEPIEQKCEVGAFLQNGFRNYTYHRQPPAYTFSMPKPLAKGGKPVRKDPKSSLIEANTAANNNPKLHKLPITSFGEWSDAHQAFVIHVDVSKTATGYALPTEYALVPADSPYLSSKHNLLTKTGHPSDPTFFKVGDVALCEATVTTVTVLEHRAGGGILGITAKHQRDEVTFVFRGWVVRP
jgi:hypothetical protein